MRKMHPLRIRIEDFFKSASFLLCISINLLVNSNTYSKCADKPVVVAVIDTGFGFHNKGLGAKLCKFGHKDFSSDQEFQHTVNYGTKDPVPLDLHGHGTNVVGVIEEYARSTHTNFCVVILKYYGSNHMGHIDATIKAINYATDLKVDYINYSSGGREPSTVERIAVEKFLNNGGTMISAAGNESANLDVAGNVYYPAMYDSRIVMVGALDRNGNKMFSSNYGSVVNRWEIGMSVVGYGISMSGTSQATATATGKIVSQSKNKCDIGD